MNRRNSHRGALRRDPARNQGRILVAAEGEFARYGLGGARVDRIAARAGANKRMLYYYFGSKDDLFLRVLEAAYAGIRSAEKDLHLADVVLHEPLNGEQAATLVGEISEALLELVDERPEATALLRGRTFARTLH